MQESIQKILPVERIALCWAKARIPYDAPQFFFGCAVGDSGGAAPRFLRSSPIPHRCRRKRRPIWQTFSPCVTQLDCTFRKFERYSREIARTFRYSTAVASSQWRPPSAVFWAESSTE